MVVAIFRTREGFEKEEMVEYGVRTYCFPQFAHLPGISVTGPGEFNVLRDVGFKTVNFRFTGRKDAFGRLVFVEE